MLRSRWFHTLELGFKSLLLQRMRAGLAALGIFIGTTTVIWLVAMGEGVSYQAQQQILELGANNIIVRTVEPNLKGENANSRIKNYGLKRKDYERIVQIVPGISAAIPMREMKFELRRDNLTTDAKLVGCVEAHLELNQLVIARGRWLTQRDDGRKVVVLAHNTAKKLFKKYNPHSRILRNSINLSQNTTLVQKPP